MIRLLLVLLLTSGIANAGEAVQIASQKLVVDHPNNRAEFAGQVMLKRSDFLLRCDRLVAHYREKAGGELMKAEAFGNIRMEHGDKRGKADEAVYQQYGGTLTLIGNAEMVEPGRTVRGEKIVHHLESARTEIVQGEEGGRVRLSIDSEKSLSEDKEKPAP